jgi:hypothetical protein
MMAVNGYQRRCLSFQQLDILKSMVLVRRHSASEVYFFRAVTRPQREVCPPQ